MPDPLKVSNTLVNQPVNYIGHNPFRWKWICDWDSVLWQKDVYDVILNGSEPIPQYDLVSGQGIVVMEPPLEGINLTIVYVDGAYGNVSVGEYDGMYGDESEYNSEFQWKTRVMRIQHFDNIQVINGEIEVDLLDESFFEDERFNHTIYLPGTASIAIDKLNEVESSYSTLKVGDYVPLNLTLQGEQNPPCVFYHKNLAGGVWDVYNGPIDGHGFHHFGEQYEWKSSLNILAASYFYYLDYQAGYISEDIYQGVYLNSLYSYNNIQPLNLDIVQDRLDNELVNKNFIAKHTLIDPINKFEDCRLQLQNNMKIEIEYGDEYINVEDFFNGKTLPLKILVNGDLLYYNDETNRYYLYLVEDKRYLKDM